MGDIGKRPFWLERLPQAVTFVDVETTGLYSNDKIVSLAAIKLRTAPLAENRIDYESVHLVFDPGKKSHPKAEEVHGYSDWTLRHQDPFKLYAEVIWKFIHGASLIAAHNADFDAGFINREMVEAGCPPLNRPLFCTMYAYRDLGGKGRSTLDAACRQMGMSRKGREHGALEDAWLAMNLYLWLHDCPLRSPLTVAAMSPPVNMRSAPPPPDGPLPRRRKLKSTKT